MRKRIAKSNDSGGALGTNDDDTLDASGIGLDVHFAWAVDDVVRAFEYDFQNIAFVIVDDPEERQPIRGPGDAERGRGNLEFRAFAGEKGVRHGIEKFVPVQLFDFAPVHELRVS